MPAPPSGHRGTSLPMARRRDAENIDEEREEAGQQHVFLTGCEQILAAGHPRLCLGFRRRTPAAARLHDMGFLLLMVFNAPWNCHP